MPKTSAAEGQRRRWVRSCWSPPGWPMQRVEERCTKSAAASPPRGRNQGTQRRGQSRHLAAAREHEEAGSRPEGLGVMKSQRRQDSEERTTREGARCAQIREEREMAEQTLGSGRRWAEANREGTECAQNRKWGGGLKSLQGGSRHKPASEGSPPRCQQSQQRLARTVGVRGPSGTVWEQHERESASPEQSQRRESHGHPRKDQD